ncbi:beta strand repeat-containing protein [Phormidium tenue]|jgi:uncharacterized repeat protein (TIGR01451 family)|uniref:DUF11 domain-containing protein n=1 Tax=Phormidium tenue FACHB-1050 TaxID=2692857 RepID=A0ABR8CFV4_9CYAN|nr:DUF11 domain-containing protein [Phormidium tenue]MBD2319549.1 DUF11 domain-containing protein [Phormidium tenue FACHB-1050]
MNPRFNLPINIEKSIKKLISAYRRKWSTLLLACLFVFFSFFPIPFSQVFFSTTSSKISLPSFIEPVNAQATPALCAVPGKDGVGAPAGVINTYYPGIGTATAGATSISVGAIDVNGALTAITAGDLLLIIQTQDATINSTNTDAYGDGVGGDVPALAAGGTQPTNGASGFTGGTAGRYEYVVATGPVAAGSVPIIGTNGGGLINSYSSAAATVTQGKQAYQVVRVPQYSSATLGSATSSFWNGNTGGIVAYDVAGNLNLTGSINVDGRGFRGGAGRVLGGAVSPNTDYRTLATLAKNGSKAEGIAGTPRYVINPTTLAEVDNTTEGYPAGSYGRGAPGNAGGGSTDGNSNANDENSGGGGGSNGGSGGIGGRAWLSDLPTGGFGGAPFPAATNLLVLGGGGGSGTTNNGSFSPPNTDTSGSGLFSSGASGGGLVMLRTNTVSGTGTISANGSNARNVTRDGGGGGGAGGSVLVSALSNNLTGLTVNVRGGNGGSAIFNEAHGPGGGGGGGVVVSNPGVIADLQGGIAGVTGIAANPNNGAVAGTGLAVPLAVGVIPGASSGAACVPALTVVKTTSTPTTNPGGTATYTIAVSNGAGLVTANNVVINDNSLPAGFTLAAIPAPTITLTGGATRPTTSAPTAGTSNLSWGTFSIPGGGSVQIQFTVNVDAGVANGTYNNPASATYNDPATGGTRTVNYIDNNGEDVTVGAPPNLNLVKRITAINNIPITGFADAPNTATSNDNDPNWPTANTQYLRGAIDVPSVQPNDVIEYTIYFLSNGGRSARNVQLCDRIPANTTFQPDTYGSGNGIVLGWDSTAAILPDPTTSTGAGKVAISNVPDADTGQFLATNVSVTNAPAPCNDGSTNPDGAILVRLGATTNVPNATAVGTPTNSYGFIRFAVRVR